MKLDVKRGPKVEKSDGLQSTAFQIKTSPKAFRALLSNLYTDKISAIIRELCSNAWDAHKEVGKENEPFFVQIPTTFDPMFVVEDYGPGLSDESIRGEPTVTYDEEGNKYTVRKGGLYTTLFDSTKEDSNDALGAYGLGSKTPFSYTDSFTIRSRHNGKELIYNAYMDESGTPQVVLLGEKETDMSGLRIEVPTEHRNDRHAWEKRAERILRSFPVTPIVEGAEIQPHERHMEGNGWALLERADYHLDSPRLVLGIIEYNLTADMFRGVRDLMEYKDLERCFGNRLLLEFEIGELLVDVSRENLDDTLEARQKIASRMDSAIQEIVCPIVDLVAQYDNHYEACDELTEKYSGPERHSIMNAVRVMCADQMLRLKDGTPLKTEFSFFTGRSRQDRARLSSKLRFSITGRGVGWSNYQDPSIKLLDKYPGIKLLDDRPEIILKDGPGLHKNAEAYAHKHNKNVILVSRIGMTKKLKSRYAERLRKLVKSGFGNVPVKLASELEAPPKEKKKQKDIIVRLFNNYGNTVTSTARWQATSKKNVKGQGIYIFLKANTPEFNGESINDTYYMNRLFEDLCLIAEGDAWRRRLPLYGVRKDALKAVQEDPNWESVEEFVARRVQDPDVKERIRKAYEDHAVQTMWREAPHDFRFQNGRETLEAAKAVDDKGLVHDINIIVDRLKQNSYHRRINNAPTLLEKHGFIAKPADSLSVAHEAAERIKARYPTFYKLFLQKSESVAAEEIIQLERRAYGYDQQ